MKTTKDQFILLFVVGISASMVFIDMTILGVALPKIQKSFDITRSESQWVVNIFLLVSAILSIAAGKLSDLFGHHKVFAIGTLVFASASLFCGLSINIDMLIISRAVQAIGCAFIMIGGMSLLADNFSEKNRGKAVGIVMSAATLMMVLSPFIGGVIIKFSSWHWIFFINVILGALIALPIIKIYRKSAFENPGGHFDWLGFVSVALFVLSTTWVFDRVGSWGWLTLESLAGFILIAVTLYAFYTIEKKGKHPLVDFSLFKITNYIPGCTILSMTQVMNLFPILIGVYIQNALGYTPFITGFLLLPAGILLALCANISGHVADKYGARFPMILGLCLLLVGFSLATIFLNTLSYFAILAALIGYGAGAAFLGTPLRTSVLRKTPKEKFGMATSILSGTKQIGGVIGFTIIASIIVHVERYKATISLIQHVPGITKTKVQILLGLLSHTPSSQSLLSHYGLQTQSLINTLILNSYVNSFFYALLTMSFIMLVALFIAIAFVKK